MPEETEFVAADTDREAAVHGADASTAWEASHWAEIQQLYHLASEAAPGERTRILREATRDEQMLTRVLDLLTWAESESEQAVEQPHVDADTGSRPAAQIGAYKLLRLLGRGGLGAVYQAERILGGAVQKCAVKVLSLHAAGPAMEARFLREQQIIATLDHPHITRMLDAGFSDEGKPFLVMEFVDGTSITEHCDAERLHVEQRIALFLQVCEAVSYAHRRLVVHLDLKPSNILVAKQGGAKLLDFGTSKLVDSDHSLTTTVLATPAYASPEQLRSQPVTTSCDVYGLGAVLFELLSGRRPWGSASPMLVMENALREREPGSITEAISDAAAQRCGLADAAALRQRLRGDLAGITARCMRNRPGDRYASVDSLADDLRRYLDGRPVLARKLTLRYRAGKFLRRNRKTVLVAAAMVLLLVSAAVFASFRQQQAVRQGQRAERMQNFLYSVLRLANTNYTGKPLTIPEFLQLGTKLLPEFIHDPADQRRARLMLAESIFDNSDYASALPVLLTVMRDAESAKDIPTQAEAAAFAGMAANQVGKTDDAMRLLTDAMALRDAKGITAAQRIWIVGFYTSARFNNGIRSAQDEAALKQVIEEGRHGGVPDRELGWALDNLATMHSLQGNVDDALREGEEALTVLRRQPYTVCDQADVMSILGDTYEARGDHQRALDEYWKWRDSMAECKGPDDVNTLQATVLVARSLVRMNRANEAVRLLEPTLPVWRTKQAGNARVSDALMILAEAYLQQGETEKAVSSIQEAIAVQTGRVAATSSDMGASYSVFARALAASHRRDEALQAAERTEAIYGALPNLSPGATRRREANRKLLEELRQGTPVATSARRQ